MFLRAHRREKDGKDHTYWSLVETVRTPDGPRQKTSSGLYGSEPYGVRDAAPFRHLRPYCENAFAPPPIHASETTGNGGLCQQSPGDPVGVATS